MSATALFEFLACALSLVAALFIFDQYLARPRPYKLLWTLGLLFYGIAAGAEGAGVAGQWTVLDYKTWYFFGGILTAAYLGLGSLYLLAPRRVAHIATAIAILIALYAAVRITFAPFAAADAHVLATGSGPACARVLATGTTCITNVRAFRPLPGDLEVAAIVMNIPGTLFLFGGAAWSAWTYWRKRGAAYRVLSMVLLAVGAVFSATLSGLQALGNSGGAALGEFLGAACILAGLLISLDVFTVFRIPFTHIVLRQRPQPIEAIQRP